ncbi:hypothetical protein GCM10009564_03740 [Streptomyces thermogriseus]|uniref:Uncharacterized protein n=1 Tax=Streptomyces thermogriseus TaxID=75292 RepID=A0ABN1SS14_9ACTN
MGIRTLPHQPAVIRADIGEAPAEPPPAVPSFAADASTARVPADVTTAVRRAARNPCRRPAPGGPARAEPSRRHPWTGTARGRLALLLARLPRANPARRVTVFVVALPSAPTGDRHPCEDPGEDFPEDPAEDPSPDPSSHRPRRNRGPARAPSRTPRPDRGGAHRLPRHRPRARTETHRRHRPAPPLPAPPRPAAAHRGRHG